MNTPMTLSRLVCLTTTLAAGSMLMTMDIANAGENYLRHRQPANYAQRYGLTPQFVISGQPVDVKRVLHHCHHHHHHHKHCYPRYQPLQTAPIRYLTPTTAGNTAPIASPKRVD
jgi:hypothetical protein